VTNIKNNPKNSLPSRPDGRIFNSSEGKTPTTTGDKKMNKEDMVTMTQIAINKFADNLKLSCDMGDRKQSVVFLANAIGAEDANKIASIFGLKDQYYRV